VIVHCRDVYPVASGKTPEWFGAWEDLYEIISSFLRSNLKNTKNIKSDIFQSPAFPFPRFHRGIPQSRTLREFLKVEPFSFFIAIPEKKKTRRNF
jgi:hypothetical protein